MPGIAFSPVSKAPPITPLRRIVAMTVAAAITAPMIGMDFDNRRESRALPQRVTWSVNLDML